MQLFSTTIIFSLLAAIIAVSPVSPIFQTVFSVPALAIETTMTCKAFREVILCSNSDAQVATMASEAYINTAFELNTIMILDTESVEG